MGAQCPAAPPCQPLSRRIDSPRVADIGRSQQSNGEAAEHWACISPRMMPRFAWVRLSVPREVWPFVLKGSLADYVVQPYII